MSVLKKLFKSSKNNLGGGSRSKGQAGGVTAPVSLTGGSQQDVDNADDAGLVRFLNSGNEDAKQQAAVRIRGIASNETQRETLVQEGVIEALLPSVQSNNIDLQDAVLHALGTLALSHAAKQRIAENEGISHLISALKLAYNDQIFLKASGALANIAANADIRLMICDLGGLSPLIEGLKTRSKEAQNNAIWALRNLTVSPDVQVAAAEQGVLPPLLKLAQKHHDLRDVVAENVAGAIANIAQNARNQDYIRQQRGLNTIVGLARSRRPRISMNACVAIGNLATNAELRRELGAAGGVETLVGLMKEDDPSMKLATQKVSAWALGNLAANDENRKRIADADGIRYLVDLSASDDPGIQADTAWALSNIARDPQVQAQMIEAGGLVQIINLASNNDPNVQLFACRALRTLASHEKNRTLIVESKGLEPLVALAASVHPKVQGEAVAAIAHLAENAKRNEATINPSDMPLSAPPPFRRPGKKAVAENFPPPAEPSNARDEEEGPSSDAQGTEEVSAAMEETHIDNGGDGGGEGAEVRVDEGGIRAEAGL